MIWVSVQVGMPVPWWEKGISQFFMFPLTLVSWPAGEAPSPTGWPVNAGWRKKVGTMCICPPTYEIAYLWHACKTPFKGKDLFKRCFASQWPLPPELKAAKSLNGVLSCKLWIHGIHSRHAWHPLGLCVPDVMTSLLCEVIMLRASAPPGTSPKSPQKREERTWQLYLQYFHQTSSSNLLSYGLTLLLSVQTTNHGEGRKAVLLRPL